MTISVGVEHGWCEHDRHVSVVLAFRENATGDAGKGTVGSSVDMPTVCLSIGGVLICSDCIDAWLASPAFDMAVEIHNTRIAQAKAVMEAQAAIEAKR